MAIKGLESKSFSAFLSSLVAVAHKEILDNDGNMNDFAD